MLVLDMFNVRQRHAAISQARFAMQADRATFAELATMPAEEIQLALELFNAKSHARTAKRTEEAPSNVRKLLKALSRVLSHIEGTPSYYKSLRSRGIALWHAFGPYTVFPIINPAELQNPWALKLLGFNVNYKNDDAFGAPINMPPVVDRWQAVARNPVACAQFFQAFRQATWEVLFGWRMGDEKQSNAKCLFGDIRAGCDRVENSKRCALHAHILLIQRLMQPRSLLILQRVQPDALNTFISHIANKTVPGGWYLRGSGEWVPTGDGT